jgi:hypothetical protein
VFGRFGRSRQTERTTPAQPSDPKAVIERDIGREEDEMERWTGNAQERFDTAESGGNVRPSAGSDSRRLHA